MSSQAPTNAGAEYGNFSIHPQPSSPPPPPAAAQQQYASYSSTTPIQPDHAPMHQQYTGPQQTSPMMQPEAPPPIYGHSDSNLKFNSAQQDIPMQNQQQPYGMPNQPPAPYGGNASNGQPRTTNYQNATPLVSLQSAPAPVDCPVCHRREMTRTEFVSGGTTHGTAAAMCLCFCLGCIPYCFSGLKDVEHKCGSCGAHLATWHRSGRTEVYQH